MTLRAALAPRSIAIVGANPGRAEVQGLKAYASIADTPEAPGGEQVASVDVDPVMLFEQGRGALAVDALVERVPACAKPV